MKKHILPISLHTLTAVASRAAAVAAAAMIAASSSIPAFAAQSLPLRQIDPSQFTYVDSDLYVSANVTEDEKNNMLNWLGVLPDGLLTALAEDNVKIYAYPSSESAIAAGRKSIRGAYVYNQNVHRHIQINTDEYVKGYNPAWSLIHEIGHAVSDHAQRHPELETFYDCETAEFEQLKTDKTEYAAFKELDPIGITSTKRPSGINTAEYFAEAFAMVYVNPDYMARNCPKLTEYVHKVTQNYLTEHTQEQADKKEAASSPSSTHSQNKKSSASSQSSASKNYNAATSFFSALPAYKAR